MELETLSCKELLKLNSSILMELKHRGIIRTRNNPLGDYTEWLVSSKMNFTLANNSKAGYDAESEDGYKIQIKGRRISNENKSRQLSAIRKYEEKDFDFLAAVIFSEDYEIVDAVLIPHHVISEYATYRAHVNAHILLLKGDILTDKRVKDIKPILIS